MYGIFFVYTNDLRNYVALPFIIISYISYCWDFDITSSRFYLIIN